MVQSVQTMSMPNYVDLELSMSSRPENINLVEPYVEKIQRHYKVNDEMCFNILIVLTEAINNCIIHGNQGDPNKLVQVRLQAKSRNLCFIISDEGQGFDPNALPDPTSPAYIDQPNGRGVFLMRRLSDQLKYSQEGRCVEIHFNI